MAENSDKLEKNRQSRRKNSKRNNHSFDTNSNNHEEQFERHPRRRPQRPHGKDNSKAADSKYCAICANELFYYALGECDHPLVCSICCLRSRLLLKNRLCPICKADQEICIVAKSNLTKSPRLFSSFPVWGDQAGPGCEMHAESGLIFSECQEHFDSVKRLTNFFCTDKNCKNKEIMSREECFYHLKRSHGLYYCKLCLDNRPLFPSEQKLYNIKDLKIHEKSLEGHPMCNFCRDRFFDDSKLYVHMNSVHKTCHLCPETEQNKYYRNQDHLQNHLKSSHFVCDLQPCNGSISSTFSTSDDLKRHFIQDHNMQESNARARSMLGFQVKRANTRHLDNEENFEDAVHVELQQQHINNIRTNNENLVSTRNLFQFEEMFPSLPQRSTQDSSSRSDLSLVGSSLLMHSKKSNKVSNSSNRNNHYNIASSNGITDRNMRLAAALGLKTNATINNAASYRLRNVEWTDELLDWARDRNADVSRIERQIKELLIDPVGTSVNLKPMQESHRQLAQKFAETLGLKSISFDEERKPYVNIIKSPGGFFPIIPLSEAALDSNYPLKRLPVISVSTVKSNLTKTEIFDNRRLPYCSYLEIHDYIQGITNEMVISVMECLLYPGVVVGNEVSWLKTEAEKYGIVQLVSVNAVQEILKIMEMHDYAVRDDGSRLIFYIRPSRHHLPQERTLNRNQPESHSTLFEITKRIYSMSELRELSREIDARDTTPVSDTQVDLSESKTKHHILKSKTAEVRPQNQYQYLSDSESDHAGDGC